MKLDSKEGNQGMNLQNRKFSSVEDLKAGGQKKDPNICRCDYLAEGESAKKGGGPTSWEGSERCGGRSTFLVDLLYQFLVY